MLAVIAAAGLAACGGTDRESWARGADGVCERTSKRLSAVGRPDSIDDLARAAERAAQELRRAGAEITKLDRPEKDPDVTRVTSGFRAAAGSLQRLADGVTGNENEQATRAVRSLERGRLRWEDAAVAVGAKRCGDAVRLTGALDSLRTPLYRAGLESVLEEFEAAMTRAATAGRPRTGLSPLDEASIAITDLHRRIEVLEPPSKARGPARQWSRDIERVDSALFDFVEAAEARRASRARVTRALRRLRAAARAELRSRRRVLGLVGLEKRLPAAPSGAEPS